MPPKTLSGRLRVARRARDLNPSALDKVAGLSRGHTSQIESGRKPNIEAKTAVKLARALSVSLEWLLNGVGEGPSNTTSAATAPEHAA